MATTKRNSPSKQSKQLTNKDIANRRRSTNNRQTERPKLVKLGALWLKEGRSGKFMSGVITLEDEGIEIKLLVFKNTYKEENRHPDYVIFEAPDNDSANNDTSNDDDIPF